MSGGRIHKAAWLAFGRTRKRCEPTPVRHEQFPTGSRVRYYVHEILAGERRRVVCANKVDPNKLVRVRDGAAFKPSVAKPKSFRRSYWINNKRCRTIYVVGYEGVPAEDTVVGRASRESDVSAWVVSPRTVSTEEASGALCRLARRGPTPQAKPQGGHLGKTARCSEHAGLSEGLQIAESSQGATSDHGGARI